MPSKGSPLGAHEDNRLPVEVPEDVGGLLYVKSLQAGRVPLPSIENWRLDHCRPQAAPRYISERLAETPALSAKRCTDPIMLKVADPADPATTDPATAAAVPPPAAPASTATAVDTVMLTATCAGDKMQILFLRKLVKIIG